LRYRTLGGTGVEVTVQCLGTMMFGAIGNADHDECIRIVDVALAHGINFIDTADMYSAGSPRRSSARPCAAAATR
jgi:aryl-alcohol dehydrogenase-like predicted oxidoreductase